MVDGDRILVQVPGLQDTTKLKEIIGQTAKLEFRLVADPGHVDGTLAMMAQWNLTGLLARLPALDVPTLFITSPNDQAVPPATSDRAAARMQAAHNVSIPGHGHLVHEEDATAVAGVILPFLAAHLPQR